MKRTFLGIRSGLFSGANLGCIGAIIVVVLVAGAMLGLVAMAVWGRGE